MQTSAVDVTATDADAGDIAALALELAGVNGAGDAKVEVFRTESRSVTVRSGVTAERKFQMVSEAAITVYRDGRSASTSTSDLSRSGLDAAIAAALQIAAVTARDEA
ncbi:peptidase U62, partial [Robbsia andropogonis]